jgi:hypothetical protein
MTLSKACDRLCRALCLAGAVMAFICAGLELITLDPADTSSWFLRGLGWLYVRRHLLEQF